MCSHDKRACLYLILNLNTNIRRIVYKNVCSLRSRRFGFGLKSKIGVWVDDDDDNNIYSGNQHHKKCFSDGSCKTLKLYKIYNSIYNVRAVFTYWYIYIYMIYQKNYETIGYMMLYVFTRIQRVSKLYFKYTV